MGFDPAKMLDTVTKARSFFDMSDLVPCNTRVQQIESPGTQGQRKIALHRGEGTWDVLDLSSWPPKRYYFPTK
jgi:hypothetical protein